VAKHDELIIEKRDDGRWGIKKRMRSVPVLSKTPGMKP
jgi:hypothetical protein